MANDEQSDLPPLSFASMMDRLRIPVDATMRAVRRIVSKWYRSSWRFALWLLLTVGFVWLFNGIPQSWIARVTMTIDARTEIISFIVDSGQRLELALPAGRYALFSGDVSSPCEGKQFEIVCALPHASSVQVDGPAQIELSILQPQALEGTGESPRIAGKLAPLPAKQNESDPEFKIRGESNEILGSTKQTIDFESLPVQLWRTQLNLTNVTLGKLLPEGTVAEPLLTEGSVRFFSRMRFFSPGRFLVKSEDLDPEDVIQLESDARQLDGPITLSESAETIPSTFHITLHTNRSRLYVTRPRGGHNIRVSNWDIVSRLPVLLAIWAAFISFMLVVTYVEGHRAAEFAQAATDGRKARTKLRNSDQEDL